jgi:glutamate dehydrogenase (NAD(P)+)
MAWLMDTYSMNVGYSVPGVVTGKPIALGGSEGRAEATGRGCVFAVVEAAKVMGLGRAEHDGGRPGLRQRRLGRGDTAPRARGAGHGGERLARGHLQPGGLDIPAVMAHKDRTGSVVRFPEAEHVTNAELLELPCDILIPAAMERQIDEHNAPRIQAKLIAEAANGPTSPEADDILADRGILVLPDIFANAGGVTVSYFEWVQALQAFPWTESQVNERLQQIMTKSFAAVYGAAQKYKVDMRTAALVLAVGRVADFTRLRGIYP